MSTDQPQSHLAPCLCFRQILCMLCSLRGINICNASCWLPHASRHAVTCCCYRCRTMMMARQGKCLTGSPVHVQHGGARLHSIDTVQKLPMPSNTRMRCWCIILHSILMGCMMDVAPVVLEAVGQLPQSLVWTSQYPC